ncbi:MAG: phosphoribosylanthranilate isomerase [Nitrososphaerota archaeon]|nr:phosphoribosylanthranilate isomerase [Nitrososphaerota archaeon]
MKICGLTREEDVAVAADVGADAVGFICGFPESPRNLSADRARDLIRRVPPFMDSVLVTRVGFAAKDPGVVSRARPSALQLYGPKAQAVGLSRRLGVKLILPRLVDGDTVDLGHDGFDALLSDTKRKGMFGGTGEVSDWRVCRRLRDAISPKPFILSGGLSWENVKDAILQVRPYAVDVSSGVESSSGKKDPAKVRAFVKAAKET